MGNKEYILKKIKELEEARKKLKKIDDSYHPRSMTARMPFGCWMWIAALAFLIFFGLKAWLK